MKNNLKFALTILLFLFTCNAYAERIVSLSPGLTEILFAIGAGDDVVGVTEFCDYPPETKKIAKVGSGFRPSIEKIVSLKPTLVLGSVEGAEKNLKNYLDNLNIRNYFFRSTDATDVINSITQISNLLNIDSSEMVLDMMDHFDKKNKADSSGLFLVGIDPFSAAGSGTFVNDIMNCSGVSNIMGDSYKGYILVSFEYILAKNPDYIFISGKMGATDIESFIDRLKRSGVKSKIIKLDCDCFLRPSQRIKQACINMRQIIR
ncbi:MAG: hypothetical protein C0602_00460 [Denitrovibrio sp.]|nr:MAG: hypothetical protein C0602_00460 [Denitrovibrio sp.]